MIYLKVSRLLKRKDGHKVRYNNQIIMQWPNSMLDEFHFNYLNPAEWKKYLRDEVRLPNGKKLPFVSEFGEEIVYDVYILGLPKELIEKASFYTNGKRTRFLNLFPGYPGDEEKYRDKEGSIKPRSSIIYGSLK